MSIDPATVEELFAESRALVALFDPADILRWSNGAFREAYDVAEGERITWSDLVRRNFQRQHGVAFAAPDFEHWLASARSRRGKLPYRSYETDLTDGRWLWMTETVSSSGWMLCIAPDISELRSDERLLRQDRDAARKASQTDELTGISNRRHVMSLLAQALTRMEAGSQDPCSVALLDIDRFKQINDSYGHAFGDQVLLDFTAMVQRNIRLADGFGRIGGEEFLLVLPHMSTLATETILERLLRLVGRPGCIPSEPNFVYSFSAGFTQLLPGDSVAHAYRRADTALYAAKNEGRSRLKSA